MTTNPLHAHLTLRGATTGTQLKLGTYYTPSIGQGSAIQSTDYYNDEDHDQNLCINPLGGNVGIARVPAYPLDVNGNTNITGNLTVSGTVTASNFIFSVQSV